MVLGTYSEWLASQTQETQEKEQPPKREPRAASSPSAPTGDAVAGSRHGKRKSPHASLKTKDLESRIAQIEERLTEIDFSMHDESVYSDGKKMKALSDERQQLREELEPLETEWLSRS